MNTKNDKDIFIWEKYELWKHSLNNIFMKVFDKEAKKLINANFYGFCDNYLRDYEDDLVYEFEKKYSRIRFFHGCRPTDISFYYKNGIVPLDTKRHNEIAYNIFLNEKHPALNHQVIDKAINDVGSDYREGLIYLALDDRNMLYSAGHYLIYGSEYIMSIAAYLPNGVYYQQKLMLYGVPTIFICDIPIIQLEENGLIWLLKDILHAITHEEFGYLDYSSCFNETIKPECIIDHYHPEYITDTHNQCRRIKVKLSEEHRKKARNTKKYTRDYYI